MIRFLQIGGWVSASLLLIAVVLAGTLTAFSGALKGVFTSATSALGSGAAASH